MGDKMVGWNLKEGKLLEHNISHDQYWSMFNYVFSDGCRKRSTYKYGLIKSILDNLFNCTDDGVGYFFSYEILFTKFAENYWNLVVKYDLRQMRSDGRSDFSKLEKIFKSVVTENPVLKSLEFESIDKTLKEKIIKEVTRECKKCVVGALYSDFEGTIYSFDLAGSGICLSYEVYEFLLKYKTELEKLNYYSWAKFLESVNSDDVLIRVLEKLELATPRRNNLSVYREILRKEFEADNCFYCGKKLHRSVHVDHFIPWVFVKDDKIWNFVLSCPECNMRKNNKVPTYDYLVRLEDRNQVLQERQNLLIQTELKGYSEELVRRMWSYAKLSGIKEFVL